MYGCVKGKNRRMKRKKLWVSVNNMTKYNNVQFKSFSENAPSFDPKRDATASACVRARAWVHEGAALNTNSPASARWGVKGILENPNHFI